LPRLLPDGRRNPGFTILRLKDKLGTRALASAEIELDGALAWPIGDEGRGVPTIIEMVNHTRLDCVLGSAAGMRRAVAEATHHAAHRSAFGRRLIDQPLMRNVLADLCLESKAATVLAFRLARSFDGSFDPPELPARLREMEMARGMDERLDRALDEATLWLHRAASQPDATAFHARHVVESAAVALQGSLVVRFSPSFVAEAFVASRLGGGG